MGTFAEKKKLSGRARAALAVVVASVLALSSAVYVSGESASAAVPATTAPLLQRDDDVVTADPQVTIQLDSGYIWAQDTIGNTVYAVGSFSALRGYKAAAGSTTTARSNIFAYDITTGDLLSFAPSVNGVIKAVAASADGTRIYIGGSFTQVNGQARYNFAALDAQTGQLVSGFSPSIGGSGVYAIDVLGDTVYVGGAFTQANGTARTNLAAFATSNGALRAWAPTTDLQVDAMVNDPDGTQVIVGGRFSRVNGLTSERGLSAIDPATGAVNTAWLANNTVINGATSGKAGIFALATDDSGVYGTGWVFADVATGNLEGTFAAEAGTGEIRWVADCHGDHYGVYSTGKVVYTTNHTHACETVNLWPEQSTRQYRYVEALTATAEGTLSRSAGVSSIYKDWSGTPSPSAYAWYPDFTIGRASGLNQAGLSITGVGDYISIAGEFTSVNNQQYQGIVRFSTEPTGGAKQGPRLTNSTWSTPTASTSAPGRVQISIPVNWDRDDLDLTYQLLRSGTSGAVDEQVVASGWWYTGNVVLNDTGLDPGETYTYSVKVTDGDGNSVTSKSVTATVSSGTASEYSDLVLDDRASLYYPLGDVASDWAGSNTPVFGSAATSTSPGAVEGATGETATSFSGNSNGRVSSTSSVKGSNVFSEEIWFQTTTNQGGKLIGFGNAQTGSSGSYDRHIYMQNNGRLTFGVYPGTVKTVTSTAAYNDGAWHHAVATLSANGMALYVDGQLVGQDATVTTAQEYTGYWRIGGDSMGSWTNSPSSSYFNGKLDEAAVYPTALTAAQVAEHYAVGAGIEAPTASFTSSASDLSVEFDASDSVVETGQAVASYTWDFGDGTDEGSGIAPSHVYASAGTYTVTLTVTDGRGLIGSATEEVTVQGPNAAPTAAFSSTTSGLTATVNGAASEDPDGSIESYSWNWGDDSADGSGTTASHAYAAAGSYTVTLTVTDDRGATATTTETVAVSHADPVASFAASSTGLVVDVDATASTASDSATLTYSWNWGDGTADGAGAISSHAYAAGGDYTVTLTVTDSVGATSETSRSVTVAEQAYAVSDDFERTVGSGWGSADNGGAYTVMSGAASAASVSDGTGNLALAKGGTRNVALQGTSIADSLTTVTYSIDQTPSTGTSYVGLSARKSASTEYLARVWLRPDGTLWLVAQRGSTTIASKALSTTWAAGDVFNLAVEVSGASPTTIQIKTWKVGTAEPAAWQLTASDSTAGLQEAGWIGVHASRGSSSTTSAVFSFDTLRVLDLNADVAPENEAPVADFTSSADELTVSVDASSSSDSDGSVASYSWSWGDGSAAGEGATASHSYAAAGTYDVTLTVTDDDGATATKTASVTVAESPVEPADDVVASDDFERTASNSWGTADVGGTWTLSGGAASAASVSGGAGKLTLAPGGTRNMQLAGVSAKDVTLSVDFSVDTDAAAGAAYVGVIARSSATDNYTVRSWLHANGSVWIVIQQGSAVIASYQVPGMTRSAGDVFTLEVDISGGASTTISAKIWKSGTTEPSTWQLTTIDATGIDAAGGVGVHASRVSSATSSTVVSVDAFRVSSNG